MPTPNYSLSRLERLYLQAQPTFGTIPNASGTASVANGDACRFIRVSMENDIASIERPDKTGTRSMQGVIKGKSSGRWSLEMSFAGSGTPGTIPDCDPVLVALFGQTAAIGTGTIAITSSTDATPIVLTTGSHGLTTGVIFYGSVAGHLINTNANGGWAIHVTGATSLTLIGSLTTGGGAGGATGAVSKVACTYTLSDEITHFVAYSFRRATTLAQRAASTCVVSEASFSIGANDAARWSSSGTCLYVLNHLDFSTYDLTQKGGLTTFPTEPAAPTTTGGIIPGFLGLFAAGPTASFIADASSYPSIRSATIRIQTSNQIAMDTFGKYYGTLTEGGERRVSLSFNVYDDDSTTIKALKLAAETKTAYDFVVQLGATVGNIWVFHLRNVFLATHRLDDGQLRFSADFGDSMATSTSLSVNDEFTMAVV